MPRPRLLVPPGRLWAAVLAGAVLMIGGLFAAGQVQSSGGVTVEAVRFRGASGAEMRALLFRPPGASPERPAPGVLAVHGYLNSAEMQSNFAIEFARRGYVVLAPDQRGHGGSTPATFADGFGGPDALAYLRSLPFVDRTNIGLEGHSMGGWAVQAAARARPDGYRAMVLEGSSVGPPFAPPGDPRFPRNLMVVFATHDEFGGFMWGPEAPTATGATEKARALFGTKDPVVAGRLYGDIAAGSARILETPAITHPWAHQSRAAIGHALDWFGRTLDGGRTLAPRDQIWPWKEAAGAVAWIGVALLLVGLLVALGRRAPFAPGPAPEAFAGDGISPRARRLGLVLAAAVPVLSYLPLMALAERLGQNGLFRQTFTNQLAVWALANSLLALALARLTRQPGPLRLGRPLRTLALAAAVAAGLYLPIALGDRLWHVSPQLWILIWRPLSPDRARDFVLYLPAFLLFMLVTLRTLDGLTPLARGRAAGAFARASAVLAGPFALFLAVQYGALWATGALASPAEGLRVIMAILFVPPHAAVRGARRRQPARPGDGRPGGGAQRDLCSPGSSPPPSPSASADPPRRRHGDQAMPPWKPFRWAGAAAALAGLGAVSAPAAEPPGLRFAFEEIVTLGAEIPVGLTARGRRNIIPITGGTFSGPGLSGTVVPGGWDWQLWRADGCLELRADYMLRTDDGAIINVVNTGTACPGPDGRLGPIRTQPVFEPPLGPYAWLGQAAFVGYLEETRVGQTRAVRIRFYRVE
ncbi:DUF3237 family protein [Phenylobacterium sp. J367]|uniref:DUF3237 family protein n=1 Tax=Phenylobacterium sp. J367 TaxID=2898435 RepID=UPI002151BF68|nr:DUF3237 family protein [Phenylobacterium sp. J367]MCR5877400.1 DUF3237 family protein [Phenylobacterium sp. J367]